VTFNKATNKRNNLRVAYPKKKEEKTQNFMKVKNSILLNYYSFNFNIIYCEIKSYPRPGIFIINIQSLKPLPPYVASSKFHVSSSKNMLFKVSSQNQGTCLCPPWPLWLYHSQGQIDKNKNKNCRFSHLKKKKINWLLRWLNHPWPKGVAMATFKFFIFYFLQK
jgi:hypothetical protein